jgi:hypothetical protein
VKGATAVAEDNLRVPTTAAAKHKIPLPQHRYAHKHSTATTDMHRHASRQRQENSNQRAAGKQIIAADVVPKCKVHLQHPPAQKIPILKEADNLWPTCIQLHGNTVHVQQMHACKHHGTDSCRLTRTAQGAAEITELQGQSRHMKSIQALFADHTRL